MDRLRVLLLTALAGGDSVILNSTINIYGDGTEPEFVGVVCQGKGQKIERGRPVIEVRPGALVYGCTIQQVDGKADRILNG